MRVERVILLLGARSCTTRTTLSFQSTIFTSFTFPSMAASLAILVKTLIRLFGSSANKRNLLLFFMYLFRFHLSATKHFSPSLLIAIAFSALKSNVGSLSSPRSVAQIKNLGPTCNPVKLPRSSFASDVSSSSFLSASSRLVPLTYLSNTYSRRRVGLLSSVRASAQVRF